MVDIREMIILYEMHSILAQLVLIYPIMSCRISRKKLEDELRELNSQIAELNSETGETAVQKLEEEIRVCKNMIKCTVCSDRPKEVKPSQFFNYNSCVL